MDKLYVYFYDNRVFCRKTLTVEDQNSFSEYFHDIIIPIIFDDVECIWENNESNSVYVDFYADTFLAVIKR